MTGFIFVGDMLVMLFMISVITWVGVTSTNRTTERSGNIPLGDE